MPEEYVPLVDKDNNVIGKIARSEMRKRNLPHRGTCIFIFNFRGEILITKRTKTKDLYPRLLEVGQGGTVSYGEEYDENAKKEVEEEVGIKNPKLEYLFDFHWKDDKTNSFARVYRCVYDGKITPQKEEVDDCFFMPVDELMTMLKKSPQKFTPDRSAIFRKYLDKIRQPY